VRDKGNIFVTVSPMKEKAFDFGEHDDLLSRADGGPPLPFAGSPASLVKASHR